MYTHSIRPIVSDIRSDVSILREVQYLFVYCLVLVLVQVLILPLSDAASIIEDPDLGHPLIQNLILT